MSQIYRFTFINTNEMKKKQLLNTFYFKIQHLYSINIIFLLKYFHLHRIFPLPQPPGYVFQVLFLHRP